MEIDSSILKYNEQAIFSLRNLYNRYGYSHYKMSRFEEYDLYVKNKDFLVSDAVITFTDRSGKLLALKPDVTLSIIKNSVDRPGQVQKVYYNENVYRVSAGSDSFREIMQAGLECIGDLTDYHIAEVVLLAAKSLSFLNSRFVLDISHMGLISAVLDNSGLSEAGRDAALEFLQQKNLHELTALCRKEQLSCADTEKLSALIECCGVAGEVLPRLQELMTGRAEQQACQELAGICQILTRCGFENQIRLDFSVENGLKYYSGVVFKGYLEGIPVSVLSGGQYDRLLKRMNRKSRAVGFAIYTDLLERQSCGTSDYDIDALILYNRDSTSADALIDAAEAAAATGSVLVTTAPPENKTWRKLYRMVNGKAVESND